MNPAEFVIDLAGLTHLISMCHVILLGLKWISKADFEWLTGLHRPRESDADHEGDSTTGREALVFQDRLRIEKLDFSWRHLVPILPSHSS